MILQQDFYDKVWDALQQSKFNLLMTHPSNFEVYKSMEKSCPASLIQHQSLLLESSEGCWGK